MNREQYSKNEDIEVDWGFVLGPRILYPTQLEETELKEAMEELCPEWDVDKESEKVITYGGRVSVPLYWRGR